MKRRLWFVILFAWFCSACGSPAGSAQTAYPPPQEPTALLLPGTPYPAPQETTALPEPGSTVEEGQSTSYPPPEDTAPPPTDNGTPYPPPGETQAPTATSPAGTGSPGPTQYPGPQDTFTPAPTQELIPTLTPGFSITTTLTVTPGVTPTERPISTAVPPPGTIAQTIRIWHSWSQSEMRVLEYVTRKFQDFYPSVAFDMLYVPYDELFQRYEMAAYRGGGPSVLFGPAEWGPLLYEKGLVADLTRDADPKFLAELQPVALGGARYRGALVGLPHRIRGGVLLYRNTSLLPQPAASFDELVSMSRQATRGGRLGAYLDRGFMYSAAHLIGLGGSLIDDQGKPAFNTPQGVEWLELLTEFDQAGGVDFNTNRDLNAFKDGKVGLLIEGSWKLSWLRRLEKRIWLSIPGPRQVEAGLRGSSRSTMCISMLTCLATLVMPLCYLWGICWRDRCRASWSRPGTSLLCETFWSKTWLRTRICSRHCELMNWAFHIRWILLCRRSGIPWKLPCGPLLRAC